MSSLKLKSLPDIVAGVWSDFPSLQLKSATQLKSLLADDIESPPIDEVIGSGVVPRLVEFLKEKDYPQLQFEAAWVLTNIASGTSDHVKVLIDHNAVPILVQLLASPSDDVREQVAWALGNIAGDSPPYRDLVLESGALKTILNQLNEHPRLSTPRIVTFTWTLSNLCRGKPQPNFDQVKAALPILEQLIHLSDEEVLKDACEALSFLSDGTDDIKIQTIIESGVVERLIQLLLHPSPSVILPALRSVGNIVTGNDEQIQLVIDGDVLPCLVKLLTDDYKRNIKKRACCMISKITAGNRVHIQSVLEANLIAPLVNLSHNTNLTIKKKVALVISNAISGGSHDQIKNMVEQGCIKPLCDLLVYPDISIITLCLGGLENILKVGESSEKNYYVQLIEDAEGLEKIEKLQSHDNLEIREKAVKILKTDWTIIEKEDEAEQPQGGEGSKASIWKRALSFIW